MLRVAQTELLKAFGFRIQQPIHAKPLDEPAELPGRRASLLKIHEVDLHTSLGEESQGLSRVSALLPAENLNFHRYGRGIIDRRESTRGVIVGPKKRTYLPSRVVGTWRTRTDT